MIMNEPPLTLRRTTPSPMNIELQLNDHQDRRRQYDLINHTLQLEQPDKTKAQHPKVIQHLEEEQQLRHSIDTMFCHSNRDNDNRDNNNQSHDASSRPSSRCTKNIGRWQDSILTLLGPYDVLYGCQQLWAVINNCESRRGLQCRPCPGSV